MLQQVALPASPKYTTQRELHSALYELFPGKDIFQNTRRKSSIVSPITGYFLELDFWIPELKLAFEFQDPHHYISLGYSNAPLEEIQQRDNIKKWQIKERGESLVVVPYWWDGQVDSLVSSIRLQRSDLFPLHPVDVDPIPDEPPDAPFKPKSIPSVGQLMLASFTDSKTRFDPTSWWMGEKYDGIRLCWSPTNKKLYSRVGSIVIIPEQFVMSFPSVFLDSEIWFGRDSVAEAQRLAARQVAARNGQEDTSWNFLRAAVFDCPDKSGDDAYVFEKAHVRIIQCVPPDHPFVTSVSYMACCSKTHAKRMAHVILRDCGEGIVLRQPESPYHHGRSNALVKIKFRDDQEGLVVAIADDEVILRIANGYMFPAPLNIEQKGTGGKVKVGDVVTFSYLNFSAKSGLPVEPKILMTRNDVTWTDVLLGDGRPTEASEEISALEPKEAKRAPYGHWTQTDGENTRIFFEDLAKSKSFDPLVPENWYTLTTEEVMNHSGGRTLLKHYGGSVAKLLMDVFPNIGLDLSKFENKPHGYWSEPLNRRKFLEKIARQKGLDPLTPETWYSFAYESIINEKGGSAMIKYHSYSLASAVAELFPEINVDKERFPIILRNHWGELANRKAFFDEFASKKGFDPLVPDNWYSVTLDDVFAEKKGRSAVKQQKGSVSKTLMEVYPDIGLDERKFDNMTQGYWHDPNHKRKFFDDVAAKQGFDPLKPENWYSLQYSVLLNEKSGNTIMKTYKYSIVLALQHVYPEIGLDISKFSSSSRKFWHTNNKRNYFNDHAQKLGFDPRVAHNWYSVSESSFMENRGLKTMVSLCYNDSFRDALVDLYPDIGLQRDNFKLLGGEKRKRLEKLKHQRQ